MNLKALITTLVLGSSSVAAAEPVFTARAQASWTFGNDRPVARDHRLVEDGRWDRPRYRDEVYHGGYYEDPYTGRDGRYFDNIKLNSDSSEYIGPIFSARRGYGWSALTEPTHIELSRQIVRTSGHFRGLMLEGVRGQTFVKMVKVRFANGGTQTIEINRSLNGRRSIELPIARGEVEYIVVYGTSNRGASYRVLGA